MASGLEVVIVDDEPGLRAMVADYLGGVGMVVREAAEAEALERLLRERPARVLIVDINMPGEDGLSLVARLRSRGERAGIILLTARGEEEFRLAGLTGGADDYIVKPFALAELRARIEAVDRRLPAAATAAGPVPFGAALLDRAARRLIGPEGRVDALSALDLALIETFLTHPRQVLSRERLSELAQGQPLAPGERALDIRIARLRRRIEEETRAPRTIVTVWGEGYRYDP